MAWYDTGTVAVTNGSTTVTGTGTDFISGAQVGEAFLAPDDKLYEIQSITSATVLVLADPYLGSTQSGQDYKIVPTQSLVADLASQVTDLITDYSDVKDTAGAGKFNDGTVTAPAITFEQDQNNGLYRIGNDNYAMSAGGVKQIDISTTDVELNYSGNKKLATTTTGVDVTGTVTADGLTSSGVIKTEGTSLGFVLNETDTTDLNTYINLQSGNFRFMTANDAFNSFNTRLAISNSTGDVSFYEDTGTTAKMVWDASAESLNLGGTATTNTAGFSQNLALKDLYPSITLEDTGSGTAKYTIGATTGALGVWDSSASAYRMFIDSAGNVGIGTSSPDSDLHISSSTAKITLTDSSVSRTSEIYAASDNLVLAADTGNAGADSHIRFEVDTSEKMRLDSSGNLLVGKTSTAGTKGVIAYNTGALEAIRDGAGALFVNRLNSDGTLAEFRKDGSTVGSIGSGGSFFHISGGSAGGTHAGLRFINNQSVRPCTSAGSNLDNTLDLGANTARFNDIYATNGTIQTSDRNEKQDIAELSDAEQRVAKTCKGLLRKFRWKDAVEEKGDEARIHFGIIAQDLQDAFTAEGLDAGRYAMFISSTWTDEETGEERTRLGVRYPELLAFIIATL